MNKQNINYISNEEQPLQAEVIIIFYANGKYYVIYSETSLNSDLSKEEQLKDVRKVFIAEMLKVDNFIFLKGLYDEEYKLLASKVMNVIAVNFDKENIYEILENIEITDFAITNGEDIIKDNIVKEDMYFEPRNIQAPLYYLNGMQEVYNKTVLIIPEVEEVSEVDADELMDDIKKQESEDKLNNVVDFKLEAKRISTLSKLRKENDSKNIKDILTSAIIKIEEIQDNNEMDVKSLEQMSVSTVDKSQAIIEAFASEIQTIKDKANLLVLKYKETKEALKLSNEKIVYFEQVVASRDEAIIKVQTNLASSIKSKELSDREVVNLQNQIKELEHKLEVQQNVIDDVTVKKDKEIEDLKLNNIEQKNIIDIFRSDDTVKTSNKKITNLEYEVVNLRDELNKKNMEIDDLKKELKKVSLDKDAYEQSSISLTKLISSKNLEARELYDKIKDLEDNNNGTVDKQYTLAA